MIPSARITIEHYAEGGVIHVEHGNWTVARVEGRFVNPGDPVIANLIGDAVRDWLMSPMVMRPNAQRAD